MGFRMRKSFKVAPGVRMTVTPRGVGASVGGKGGRVSVHSSGRVTKSVGIPGTGVSYVSSSGGGSRRKGNASQSAAPRPSPATYRTAEPSPAKPGLLAPRWEKDLYKAATADPPKVAEFVSIGRSDPKARHAAMVLDAFMGALTSDDSARARDILEVLNTEGVDPAAIPFLTKYSMRLVAHLAITEEVTITAPVDRDVLGLTLAELRQQAGEVDSAIQLVEGLTPSTVTAVSLAELYASRERWNDVIEITEGVDNEDDLSMYLLIQRGVAFREKGHHEASRESLKKALSRKGRADALRHLAHIERGQTYMRENKKAMARKDFERVMAENSSYPGLAGYLDAIGV